MDNVRKVINNVLDKSSSDISPSKEDRFKADMAALFRSYGVVVESGKVLCFFLQV